MTYQCFQNADGDWEIWNIKGDYVVMTYQLHEKAKAISVTTQLNRHDVNRKS